MKNKLFLTGIFIFFSLVFGWAQNVTKEDPLNGPRKEYYPSGKLCKEYTVSDGVPNGLYKFYSEKGFLVAEQNLVEGIQQGIQKTFYENGQVESEMNYEKGIPQGLKKEYFNNGTLKSESFLTGEPWEFTGYTTLYYEDGKKKAESKVSMGKLVIAITYDKEGRVTSEQTEGKIISYWYENDGKKHTSINGVEQK
jgi:antitoxin component YwqK of YwqJK toxin-antitoxin module